MMSHNNKMWNPYNCMFISVITDLIITGWYSINLLNAATAFCHLAVLLLSFVFSLKHVLLINLT